MTSLSSPSTPEPSLSMSESVSVSISIPAAAAAALTSANTASADIPMAYKGDPERHRAEIYAVNQYLQRLEQERFAKLCETMEGEALSDFSWGSEYSSDDITPFRRSSFKKSAAGGAEKSASVIKGPKAVKKTTNSSSKVAGAGLGGV
jgi:hypothetical protein